jgi:hypothetical protein
LINERLRKLATDKLSQYAAYLIKPEYNITIASIVESSVIQRFEHGIKRASTIPEAYRGFVVNGLMPDPAHGFNYGRLEVSP